MADLRAANGAELLHTAKEALELHNGNLNRATTMLALILSRRVYLLDALIYHYLERLQRGEPDVRSPEHQSGAGG